MSAPDTEPCPPPTPLQSKQEWLVRLRAKVGSAMATIRRWTETEITISSFVEKAIAGVAGIVFAIAIGVGVSIAATDPTPAIWWFTGAAVCALVAIFLFDDFREIRRWKRIAIIVAVGLVAILAVSRADRWVADRAITTSNAYQKQISLESRMESALVRRRESEHAGKAIEPKEPHIANDNHPAKVSPPLITMRLRSLQVPIYVPPHSETSVLELSPYVTMTDTRDDLFKIENDTGKEGCWPSKGELDSKDSKGYEMVYRVEIGNHSQRTLQSGKAVFGLKYNDAFKFGCNKPSDAQPDQRDVVLIPTLDPGKSFEFYTVNQSDRCVWLLPPISATVKMADDEKEIEVPLTLDKNPLYAFAPFFGPTTIKWSGARTHQGGYGASGGMAQPC